MHDNDDIVIGAGPLNEYFARWRIRYWRIHKPSVYKAPDFGERSKPVPEDIVVLDGMYGTVLYIDWDCEEVKVLWFKSQQMVSYDLSFFTTYDHPRGSYKRHWNIG